MKKKYHEILLVPPGGKTVKTLLIRRGFIALIVLVLAGGFAGYFIPLNSFSVDVVEQNRKTNLENQNKRLQSAIRPMRQLLDNLNEQIQQIESKRKGVASLLGISDQKKTADKSKVKSSQLSVSDLLTKAESEELFYRSLLSMIARNPGYFDSVPSIRPIEKKCAESAHFEKEKDPFTQTMKTHLGIDYIATRGVPVVSTAAGVVARTEDSRLWGKRIFITNGYGFSTVYAHLATIEVSGGKHLNRGDRIGTLGSTGMTSGPHLHYEVWYEGEAVNPESYLFPQVDSLYKVASK